MAIRSTSQIKPGEKLKEEVHTPLGGLLFTKGWVIREKDIDILKAFFIRKVLVEADESTAEGAEEHVENTEIDEIPPIFTEYERLLKFIKKLFSNLSANSSHPLPLLELRDLLKGLLQHINLYNVLSFKPASFKHEDYYYHNSILTAMTSYLLADWHGLPQKDHFPIAMAGLLHDIGNVGVDSDILHKSGKLTSKESEQIRKHTVIGYNLLKNIPALNDGIKLSTLQHHEKIDGTGYPLGVKGDRIHLYAKIIAVADIYHAMTSKRNYKNAESPYLVLEQLYNEAFGKLDPAIVQTLINKLTQIHNGILVRLSDKSVGEIVFTDRSNPTRPWVKIDGKIVNLSLNRSLYIEEIVRK